MIDIKYKHPDGRVERIRETARTRRGAERREREIYHALENRTWNIKEEAKDHISLSKFSQEFIENYAEVNNKLSEIESKKAILRRHLVPAFGRMKVSFR